MSTIKVADLQADLPFGARITGVTQQSLADPDTCDRIRDVFERRGLIVFDGTDPSSELQVAISRLFGPLKEHPIKLVNKVDENLMPGVIEINHDRETSTIVEIDGEQRVNWLFWHFDHCYNNELNRAGVLRGVEIPPEDGMTVFADGIDLYRAFSPEMLRQIAGREIIYRFEPDSVVTFARPESLRIIRTDTAAVEAFAKSMPRAIHPAVWTRASGEKVLHLSPWMAVGVVGLDEPEAHALLEAASQELTRKVRPYYHAWRPDEMLIWDNWRMIHAATGTHPRNARMMHRTTIRGDYGLGRWETEPQREIAAGAM